MIVEIAGRPASHLKEALSQHIGILNQVNDIEVHSIKLSEPKEIEGHRDMFTCFAEADFETPNFGRLAETMFDFMPSSVEVIEPGKVTMDMVEATALLNNISGRMHRYDEIAKIANIKINQLNAQLQEAQKKLEEKEKPKKVAKKKVTSKKKKK